jgi:UDP-N-acetylglucosamine 2-epimerase (non-hydrolysing)
VKIRALLVVGTRPEAVKMAPVVKALRADKRFDAVVAATGQHREMLDLMLRDFGYAPDFNLKLMRPGQSMTDFLSKAMRGLDAALGRIKPHIVLAQGDTTTVLAAALTAFDRKIMFGHVEAGLRTGDKRAPFPEEKIRVMTDHISDMCFAPTPGAKRNLVREGISTKDIFVTGNTVVDALKWATARPHAPREASIKRLPDYGRLAVVTLHRRESFGAPLENILHGLAAAARTWPDICWVLPVHPNPNVAKAVKRVLSGSRVRVMPPLGYLDFMHVMKRADFLVTDSGGIQEEAPSFGVPVLVAREKTERPEALKGGFARLIGASGEGLLAAIPRLPAARHDRPGRSPFGDGRAAERIAAAILYRFGRIKSRPGSFA